MDKRRDDRPGEECGGHNETARSSGPGIEAGASKRVRKTRFVAASVRGNRDGDSAREATH
jgi:hypothetical protein